MRTRPQVAATNDAWHVSGPARTPVSPPCAAAARWKSSRHPTGWAPSSAREIADGWYRAQALSTVADHAPESAVLAILDESVEAANSCSDTYRRVAVLSWPLEIAFKHGRIDWVERERDRAVALAPQIEPAASRAFAMQILWGGCYMGGPAFAVPVWRAILQLCPPDRSWRAARLYRHIADVLESRTPGAAAGVIQAMPAGKARAKLARRLGLAEIGWKLNTKPPSSPPPPMV
jgi:hypothetical protein